MTSVDRVMSRPVYTCTATDSLSTAARLMWERDCGVIPVVDEWGELVGIVTDRDICMTAFTQGKPLQAIPVATAMSGPVHSCHPDDTIEAVERLMRERQIRRVPVVDNAKRPVGVVSLNDLTRDAEARKESGVERDLVRTMAAVCEPRLAA